MKMIFPKQKNFEFFKFFFISFSDGNREYATTVGDYKISGVRDLTTGFDNTKPEDKVCFFFIVIV